jgi:Phytanoyl-CoA dioxygenase (PhyH)
MEKIFKDPRLQKQYDQIGYAQFSLLDSNGCAEVKNSYMELESELEFQNGWHNTMDMGDPGLKSRIWNDVISLVIPRLEAVFENYDCFFGSLLIKKANFSNNVLPIHQDWSLVAEEDGFNSGTLYIAINDIPKKRGGIGFVPKSHLWSKHTRYNPIKLDFNPFVEHQELLLKYSEFKDLRAGEAILWNHRTLHTSWYNETNEDRLVVGLGIKGIYGPLQIHYQSPENPETVGVYNIEPSFFTKNKPIDLYNLYLEGNSPFKDDPIRVYKPSKRRFSGEKLEKAILKSSDGPVVPEDLFLQELKKNIKSPGIFSKLSALFQRN